MVTCVIFSLLAIRTSKTEWPRSHLRPRRDWRPGIVLLWRHGWGWWRRSRAVLSKRHIEQLLRQGKQTNFSWAWNFLFVSKIMRLFRLPYNQNHCKFTCSVVRFMDWVFNVFRCFRVLLLDFCEYLPSESNLSDSNTKPLTSGQFSLTSLTLKGQHKLYRLTLADPTIT